jgi:DsbC/DsbD-like thiol-disulfide interchange protein
MNLVNLAKTIALVLSIGLCSCGAASTEIKPEEPPPATPQVAGKEHPVQALLTSNVSAVAPGEKFLLGVLLSMKPGWHVYWKNPGDAGLPPTIELSLPPGFTSGPIAWPVPTKFVEDGDIVTYGYDDEVMLFVPVSAPSQAAVETRVPITARLKWLTCETVCIQGSAEVGLTLAVERETRPANASIFEQWSSRLPADGIRSGSPARARSTGRAKGMSRAAYTVTLDWLGDVKAVESYPGPDSARTIENARAETVGRRTRISFDTEILAGQKNPSDVLELVVAYEDQRGARLGITVPVAAAERLVTQRRR